MVEDEPLLYFSITVVIRWLSPVARKRPSTPSPHSNKNLSDLDTMMGTERSEPRLRSYFMRSWSELPNVGIAFGSGSPEIDFKQKKYNKKKERKKEWMNEWERKRKRKEKKVKKKKERN
jgi:hypothetical protein